MPKTIDAKTLILIVLTASAVMLTYIRERPVAPREISEDRAGAEAIRLKEISGIVDSTFRSLGIVRENIRHVKVSVGDVKNVREETKVQAPKKFDVLRAMSVLGDSLRRFDVSLVATENLKEKTSSIHLIRDKRVFHSIVISRELQKGVVPSASRKHKGMPRKARQ